MVLAHQFGFLGNPSATTTATRLRDELRAGDVVLDATTHRQGLDAFYGLAPVQAAAQPRGTTAVTGSGIEAERRFVVGPLAEVRPDLVLPDSECPVHKILARMPANDDVRLFSDRW